MFLSKDPMAYDITQDSDYATINNKNILNQRGLLLLNPNGTTSLVDTALHLLKEYKGASWFPIKCLNFNKNLKKHVDQFLELNRVNEKTVEPINFVNNH